VLEERSWGRSGVEVGGYQRGDLVQSGLVIAADHDRGAPRADTIAADRMSPALAALTDPWQPAVLTLAARAAAAGQRLGNPAGVCGEVAADPALACVLVGFGVGSLSMAAGAVAAVGAGLAEVTHEQCERAGAAALAATDPAAARAAVRAILDQVSSA
jgi:phosphotransferase system enzyme I (PtsI)